MNLLKKINSQFSLQGDASLARSVFISQHLKNGDSPLAYISTKFRFLYINNAYADLCNIQADELKGKYVSSLWGIAVFNNLRPLLGKVLNNEDQSYELVLPLPSGMRYLEEHCIPDQDEMGKVRGYVCILADISKMRLSNGGLKEAELQNIKQKAAMLAAIVESSNDAIISKSLDGIITSWNAAAERMYGYTAHEMIGQPVLKLIPPDRRNEETVILDRLKRGEVVDHFETKRITKDNQQIDVSLTISPIRDTQGTIIGASKVARDISDKIQLEKALRANVDLFRTMVDHVPAMVWMSGPDRSRDFFNNTWLQYTGRTQEQERNEGWLKNVHPDDVKLCKENYDRSFRRQKAFYTEYRLRRSDGQYRWIADNSAPRYNADGSFEGFISACMDINDQKQFREKILERELHFKTITNVTPVGLWMTDSNAQNIFVNDTWVEWTGIPCELQMGTGWLDKVAEEDKVDTPAKFWDSLSKREKYSAVFRIRHPSDRIRWCLTEGSPYYDIDGEFAGYAGSVTDITELRKLEERKDDFIKMASHELKTPITSIKGYVQLLTAIYEEFDDARLHESRPTIKSSLGIISKQVSKLTRLVSELLDLSRIESGRLDLNKTSFDLQSMMTEVIEDMKHMSPHHKILLNDEYKGNIYADKDRTAQVILNLLTNAIKYSPQGDIVEVAVRGDKDNATISIKDFGIGIDKKDHHRIFERFYRVEGKNEQTFPGFGIGLFIASEIIQRHDGTINVESDKGNGATFTITLPVFSGPGY